MKIIPSQLFSITIIYLRLLCLLISTSLVHAYPIPKDAPLALSNLDSYVTDAQDYLFFLTFCGKDPNEILRVAEFCSQSHNIVKIKEGLILFYMRSVKIGQTHGHNDDFINTVEEETDRIEQMKESMPKELHPIMSHLVTLYSNMELEYTKTNPSTITPEVQTFIKHFRYNKSPKPIPDVPTEEELKSLERLARSLLRRSKQEKRNQDLAKAYNTEDDALIVFYMRTVKACNHPYADQLDKEKMVDMDIKRIDALNEVEGRTKQLQNVNSVRTKLRNAYSSMREVTHPVLAGHNSPFSTYLAGSSWDRKRRNTIP